MFQIIADGMCNMKIKMLKDYRAFRKDSIANISDGVATELIRRKFAEVYVDKKAKK